MKYRIPVTLVAAAAVIGAWLMTGAAAQSPDGSRSGPQGDPSVSAPFSAYPGGSGSNLPSAAATTARGTKSRLSLAGATRAAANGERLARAQSAAVAAEAPNLSPSLAQAAGLAPAGTKRAGPASPTALTPTFVTVTGSGALAAARAQGAIILAQAHGAVSISVAPAKLKDLARSAGVRSVGPSNRAYAQSITSQGVSKSNALAQINAGNRGTGVKIGIVDIGFQGLSAAIASGDLPAGLTVAGNYCGTGVYNDPHGTAVAEIIHEMAPDAKLYLYCVADSVGFSQAETNAASQQVTIVNSSLGFIGDGRGDGTGYISTDTSSGISTVDTVRRARQTDHILWIQSAGNSAQDHWSGSLTDPGGDHLIDLYTTSGPTIQSYDLIELPPQGSAEVALTWDQWPAATTNLTLTVTDIDGDPTHVFVGHVASYQNGGHAPIRVAQVTNSSPSSYHDYQITISYTGSLPSGVRYDLMYAGEMSPSALADPAYWTGWSVAGNPARGASGSVMEPASSPYALAVGAAYYGNSTLESFSSRGPTIDGRVKPDIIGFDGVSSAVYGSNSPSDIVDGFYGTSAAAPHVAGAAALISAGDRRLNADQIEAALRAQTANHQASPTNALGSGILHLNNPTGSLYNALATPTRILDTRTNVGGHKGLTKANGVLSIGVPTSIVPADATSIVVNLTGTNATTAAHITVYPVVRPPTSNLNLSTTDPTAAVTAVIALNYGHGFRLYTSASVSAIVDVVGYFAPPQITQDTPTHPVAARPSEAGYTALAPSRIFDSRNGTGGHLGKLANAESVTVNAAVPSGATAAVINLTAVNGRSGFLNVAPTTSFATSTLNYTKYTRANLAVVSLSAAGTFQLVNSGSPVDTVIDLLGYFKPGVTSGYVSIGTPLRMVDTRYGTGTTKGVLVPGQTVSVQATGHYGVVSGSRAVWANVTEVAAGLGFVVVYPKGLTPIPRTSTVNFTAGRIVPNAAIATLSGGGAFSANQDSGRGDLIEDLFGYFTS